MKLLLSKQNSKNKVTSKVYITKSINADGLMAVYEALNQNANGKVAVKISSGEPGGNHFLSPKLIEPLVKSVNGTIIECNTAYGGKRADTKSHLDAVKQHGFADIATIDIMDANGSMSLPVKSGKHLKENLVGDNLKNYDFVINLAHFKGHAMGGFGGVLKNMSIGIASAEGKMLIHTAGKTKSLGDFGLCFKTPQDDFLESMAEAASSVADYIGNKIIYINVMNNLSVDCDCDSNPAAPEMTDIGILASLDPVALDQACVDLVYAAEDGKALIERIESRNGIHTVEYAEEIGMGSRNYELYDVK